MEVGEGVVYPLADTVETLWPLLGYSDGSFAGSTRCSSEIRRLVPHKVIYDRSILQGEVHARGKEEEGVRKKSGERKRWTNLDGQSIGALTIASPMLEPPLYTELSSFALQVILSSYGRHVEREYNLITWCRSSKTFRKCDLPYVWRSDQIIPALGRTRRYDVFSLYTIS